MTMSSGTMTSSAVIEHRPSAMGVAGGGDVSDPPYRSSPEPSAAVTLREVYQLLEVTRRDLTAEIKMARSHIDDRLQDHEREHEHQESRRQSSMRWAVTTVVTMIGIFVAIFTALIVQRA